MIKNILLDIGKVLTEYDWDIFVGSLFPDRPEVAAVVKDAFWNHGVWDELDRGNWSREQLIEGFVSAAPAYAKEICYAFDQTPFALTEQPYAQDWIKWMKKEGYQVYFLSNWSYHILENAPHLLDFLELTDGGVFSCHVKMIKPEPEIYRCICEKYNLKPEECVFIDDKQENVDGAKSVGMQAICYRSFEQTDADLRKLLGK